MPLKIVRNDITKMQVDAIVNTANRRPVYGAGIDIAVYKAAGEELLLAERKKIGYMNEGDAAITPGFKLSAKYIIHAVSPRYINGESGEEEKLRSCYRKSLKLAKENACESIAFPLIATGAYGYPKEEGIRIAVDEINTFLLRNEMLIYLVVFDTEATRLGLHLYPRLKAYIDHNYVCEKREEEYGNRYFGSVERGKPGDDAYHAERVRLEERLARPKAVKVKKSPSRMEDYDNTSVCESISFDDDYYDFFEEKEFALKERIRHAADTFQEYLFYLIKSKGLTNAEVYKSALITKQLFSKIKQNPQYHPDKATALKLCVGAKLNLDETKDLLARAGYALSPSDVCDIIFTFFIENGIHDMVEIDIALEENGLPCFIQ